MGLGAKFPNWLASGEAETGGSFGWFGWGVDDHYDVSRNQYDFTNGPDTGLGDLQFGQVLSARDPRILQFALKYIF